MSNSQQGDDIQELKLDVGLIKGDIKTIKRDMSNNQRVIIDRMDKFAFVPQKDHDRDMQELRDAIKELSDNQIEDRKIINAGGLKSVNFIFGNATRVLLTALSLGVIVIIVVSLASTLPAVQSALGNVK